MATLVEMALEMVMARARSTALTADEIVTDLKRFHLELKNLESGAMVEVTRPEENKELDEAPFRPALTVKEAFKSNEIACMVCGKGGFTRLTKHLHSAHDLKPNQYREMCGIPRHQSLTAQAYSEKVRKNNAANSLQANEKAKIVKTAKRKPAEGIIAAPAREDVPEKTKLVKKRATKSAAIVAAAE